VSESQSRVIVSFEPDSSELVARGGAELWLLESPENRAAAFPPGESARATVFKYLDLGFLLWSVLEHHPGCTRLEVRGRDLDSAALEERGFGEIEVREGGFTASREEER